jgi:hypothetical protein
MRTKLKVWGFFLATCLAGAVAHAQDTGATGNGDWSNSSIWTGGSVPGSSNNVYIGSTYPTGSASTATVTLTADESASNLYLGNGSSTSGTLDLGTNTLTVGNILTIGDGGAGAINEGADGSFTTQDLLIESGNSYTFGTADQVTNQLVLEGTSSATTSASGNLTGTVDEYSGSTLNLGANLSLSGNLDVEQTGSVLNMNGNNISANVIQLGWNDNVAVTLSRGTTPGSLTANTLEVYGQTFNLLSSDAVTAFYLADGTTTLNSGVAVSRLQLQNGSTATTTATGNVTGNLFMYSGSTLNLGANLDLTSNLDVEDSGSVLNMNGNNISANVFQLGWNDDVAVTLNRGTTPGSLSASTLEVYGQTFNLLAADTVTNFYLADGATTLNSGVAVSQLQLENSSTGTTTTSGNVTGNLFVYSGSTLNLGAKLSISGELDVENTGSVLNMNGNNISAGIIELGYADDVAVTLNRGSTPGSLTASNLYVYGQTFNLLTSDSISTVFVVDDGATTLNSGVSVPYLDLQNGSTGTTTTTGNITTDITVDTGSTLNLGANVSISATLSIQNASSVLNGNGHNIAATSLFVGYNGSAAASLTGVGTINAVNFFMDHGSTATIEGGVVSNEIYLNDGSVLTVDQTGGTGLTLNGTSASDLTTDPSSMDLIFDSAGWDFRWQDPAAGGNWISTIDAMIASGQIVVTAPDGYSVVNQGGYTYIQSNAVPEPASGGMVLGAAMLLAIRRPRSAGER